MDERTRTHILTTKPQMLEKLEKVEKALGFELHFWQVSRITTGYYRQAGTTTAEILKILLSEDKTAIVFMEPPRTFKERFFRNELVEIRYRLAEDGIEVPEIYNRMQYETLPREKRTEVQKNGRLIRDARAVIPATEM